MRFTRFAMTLGMVVLALFAAPATAWNRSPATQFAALPAGTAHPEGIAADAKTTIVPTVVLPLTSKLATDPRRLTLPFACLR